MAPGSGKLIVECPSCGQLLNIPANRRKLQLTCPKCRTSWLWTSEADPAKEKTADSQRKPANLLALFLGPFKEYWQGLSRWNRPDDLASFIKRQQPMSAEVIHYILGATGAAAVVAQVIGYKEGSLEFIKFPIVNEILVVLVFLAGGLASSALWHTPLRLVGGRATFRQSCLAACYVAVTFLPFIVLLEGVYLRITHRQLPGSTYTGSQLVYAAMLLGKIHQISFGRALAAIGSVTIALLIVVVVVIVRF